MPSRFAVLFVLALTLVLVPAAAAKKGNAGYQTGYDDWRTFAGWTHSGTAVAPDGSLTLAASGLTSGTDVAGAYYGGNYYNGGAYQVGEAISPVTTTSFGFTEAIASWNAATPAGSWIETWIRAQIAGRWTKWYSLGVWASGESDVSRHSVRLQGDTDGFVAVDTLVLSGKKAPPADAYQTKLQLFTANGAAPERALSRGRLLDGGAGADHAPAELRCRAQHAARRARALADGLSGRRQRLVQPDVDLDGARVLERQSGDDREPRALDRHRRLRLDLRRARQLAVQHGVRRHGGNGGQGCPVHVDERRRGMGRRGRSGHLQLRVEEGRDHRLRRVVERRSSRCDRRLRRGGQPDRQRPRSSHERRGAADLQPGRAGDGHPPELGRDGLPDPPAGARRFRRSKGRARASERRFRGSGGRGRPRPPFPRRRGARSRAPRSPRGRGGWWARRARGS